MLRNLILGLLLANVLLLAWGRWIVAPDVIDPRALGEVTEPQLVLLKTTARSSQASSLVANESGRCFRLGPFSSAEGAEDVGGQLSARGLLVNRWSGAGQIWVGHWVLLEDLPGLDAAREALNTLVSGGIRDAYIASREPTVDISLGVFRGRQGADEVIRLARKVGYSPVAVDRFREGTEHWVEVVMPADQPPDPVDLRLSTSGAAQIVRIEEQPCTPAEAVINGDDGDAADDSLESLARDTAAPESSTPPE